MELDTLGSYRKHNQSSIVRYVQQKFCYDGVGYDISKN